ncbi:hypothetical protein CRG98_006944 [Punica granatum]|uniref:Uncharacterized protein n=1 Tax=Punica granatum TaxID=22663 RepID=A0A2I0KVS4_PUNGR|nr:hypothetical protein CRG98_006944 [Punica granatum]
MDSLYSGLIEQQAQEEAHYKMPESPINPARRMNTAHPDSQACPLNSQGSCPVRPNPPNNSSLWEKSPMPAQPTSFPGLGNNQRNHMQTEAPSYQPQMLADFYDEEMERESNIEDNPMAEEAGLIKPSIQP